MSEHPSPWLASAIDIARTMLGAETGTPRRSPSLALGHARASDRWVAMLSTLGGRETTVAESLAFIGEPLTRANQMRAGNCLRALGLERTRVRTRYRRGYVYRAPAAGPGPSASPTPGAP